MTRRFGAWLVILVGCGHSAKTPTPVSLDGGADASASMGGAFATSPPPSGLPPMAVMPPPGVVGSKKAKRRIDAALAACGTNARPQAKDTNDGVKKAGEACAAASKMKPVGQPMRGAQADKDAHQENKFRAEGNHCYRVYVVTDEAARDAVVVLRDSSGDIIAEGPAPAVPSDGSACFSSGDEVSVLVSIGTGKGSWSAQVWSD